MVGSGDNLVHIYDLETREELQSLKGHENFIHGLSHCPATDLIASGSEDGTVRLWDPKKKRPCTQVLKPDEEPKLQRPNLGKWIGAVTLSAEWMVRKTLFCDYIVGLLLH